MCCDAPDADGEDARAVGLHLDGYLVPRRAIVDEMVGYLVEEQEQTEGRLELELGRMVAHLDDREQLRVVPGQPAEIELPSLSSLSPTLLSKDKAIRIGTTLKL